MLLKVESAGSAVKTNDLLLTMSTSPIGGRWRRVRASCLFVDSLATSATIGSLDIVLRQSSTDKPLDTWTTTRSVDD